MRALRATPLPAADMKITQAHAQIVRFLADEPLAGGPAIVGETHGFVTLRKSRREGGILIQ